MTSLLTTFQLKSIGRVESTLTDLAAAPRQADEGAPEAVLVFEPEVRDALGTLQQGETVILLTWLDRAWTSRVLSTDIRQR